MGAVVPRDVNAMRMMLCVEVRLWCPSYACDGRRPLADAANAAGSTSKAFALGGVESAVGRVGVAGGERG